MPNFTIPDLKRALVEVREICKTFSLCEECPFNNERKAFCVLGKSNPSRWEIDDWKEERV